MEELFGGFRWSEVKSNLRHSSLEWWEQNRETIVSLTKDEVGDLAREFVDRHNGDVGMQTDAKLAIAMRMSPEDWRAYRDGTTDALRDIAKHRFELFNALGMLSRHAARLIGQAIMAAL